ncbi:hypothetical protein MKW94_000547 [Papaver nudicaule]|uniref:Uncharacterized protein n=1 Tax=Papaver nudicaule TaxID=74823 RepID=A0AA41V6A9_PAPNU|nr:hypothetical protein [Papaver nudicaule]
MDADEYADICAGSRKDADYAGEHSTLKIDPAENARRVAYWKDRCAGTISKAEAYLGFTDEKNKVKKDPIKKMSPEKPKPKSEAVAERRSPGKKLKIERERAAARIALEKKRREQQTAKSKAAAEIASQRSREAKLQRERERAAARTALEKMETVDIYNSHDIVRDFERMIFSTPPYRVINWPMFLQTNGLSIT